MKTVSRSLLRSSLLVYFFMLSAALWAQDQSTGGSSNNSATNTTTTTSHSTSGNTVWYTQPWVWIVGAAVFILLLVALLNGSKSRNTTTERTVIKDR